MKGSFYVLLCLTLLLLLLIVIMELGEISFEKRMGNETKIVKEELSGQCSEWRNSYKA